MTKCCEGKSPVSCSVTVCTAATRNEQLTRQTILICSCMVQLDAVMLRLKADNVQLLQHSMPTFPHTNVKHHSVWVQLSRKEHGI